MRAGVKRNLIKKLTNETLATSNKTVRFLHLQFVQSESSRLTTVPVSFMQTHVYLLCLLLIRRAWHWD